MTDDELRAALRRYIETDREDAESDPERETVRWCEGATEVREPLSRVRRLVEEILREGLGHGWSGLL